MKTILITGATAGIGKHAALAFARAGHHVIAAGRRAEALVALQAEAEAEAQADLRAGARSARGKIDILRLDVTKNVAVVEAARAVLELTDGRGIDVLVNNAGYGQMGPVESVSDEELRKQYDTNVFGLMNVTRAFVPQMRRRGAGRIINVGSIGGRMTFPLMGAYNSTKYAVESLSDALRNELAPFGIQVSIVEPGPIRTEFNDRAMETIDHARFAATPYAQVVARAEEFRKTFEKQAAGPEVVTKAIVHAATARRARVRYVVPFSSQLMLGLVAVIPTRILDALMRAISGLTRKNILAAPESAPSAPSAAST